MLREDPSYFDIDVDLAPILNAGKPVLISERWYQLLHPKKRREPQTQRELELAFREEMLFHEWLARDSRIERRGTIRAPLLTRVISDHGVRFLATNVSTTGLCCSGRPNLGCLNIEFKIPGLAFPVAARAEVASFSDRPVIPLVGLRFVDIDKPYIEYIGSYIDNKRRSQYSNSQASLE